MYVFLPLSIIDPLGLIHQKIDNGAVPMDVQRTVEYHRPSRNSANYSANTDLSLGMTATAPSAFRSPITNYDPILQPSRAAPAPPIASSSRSSTLNSPARGTLSKSNSPNPNRYSAGQAMTGYQHYPAPPSRSATTDTNPSPPPFLHSPFSAPNIPYAETPYSVNNLEKQFDDANLGLGVGMPMQIVDRKDDKELPKEPATVGRNRSGTGKSSKDKKSVFGVLTGRFLGRAVAHSRSSLNFKIASHFYAI